MDWSFLVRMEWAIPELILLPLLFWDLYLTRRSQKRDKELAARALENTRLSEGVGHSEGQHRLDPEAAKPIE
jgi:hypothetical protein